jgi:CBS domain-containing protein
MKSVKVEEVFDPTHFGCALGSEDEPIENVIGSFAHDPRCGTVLLFDPQQRLAGIITRDALLKWAHIHLGDRPGGLSVSISDMLDYALSATAKDLVLSDWQSVSVKLADGLDKALEQMLLYGVNDIPVVDEDGNFLGSLGLSHVLLKAIEVGKQDRYSS